MAHEVDDCCGRVNAGLAALAVSGIQPRVRGWLDKSEFRPGGIASSVMQALFAAGSRKRRYFVLVGHLLLYGESAAALADESVPGELSAASAIDVWDLSGPGCELSHPDEAGARAIVVSQPRHLKRPSANEDRKYPYLLVVPPMEDFADWSHALRFHAKVWPTIADPTAMLARLIPAGVSRQQPLAIGLCNLDVATSQSLQVTHWLQSQAGVVPTTTAAALSSNCSTRCAWRSVEGATPREMQESWLRHGKWAVADGMWRHVLGLGCMDDGKLRMPELLQGAHGVPNWRALRVCAKEEPADECTRPTVSPLPASFDERHEAATSAATSILLLPLAPGYDASEAALRAELDDTFTSAPEDPVNLGDGAAPLYAVVVLDDDGAVMGALFRDADSDGPGAAAEMVVVPLLKGPGQSLRDPSSLRRILRQGLTRCALSTSTHQPVVVVPCLARPCPALSLETGHSADTTNDRLHDGEPVIVAVGADGAGKTTVLQQLMQYLAGAGAAETVHISRGDGSPVSVRRFPVAIGAGFVVHMACVNVSSACPVPVRDAYLRKASLVIHVVDLTEPYTARWVTEFASSPSIRSVSATAERLVASRGGQSSRRAVSGPQLSGCVAAVAATWRVSLDEDADPWRGIADALVTHVAIGCASESFGLGRDGAAACVDRLRRALQSVADGSSAYTVLVAVAEATGAPVCVCDATMKSLSRWLGARKATSLSPTQFPFALMAALYIGVAAGDPSSCVLWERLCQTGSASASDAPAVLRSMSRTRAAADRRGRSHSSVPVITAAMMQSSLRAAGLHVSADVSTAVLEGLRAGFGEAAALETSTRSRDAPPVVSAATFFRFWDECGAASGTTSSTSREEAFRRIDDGVRLLLVLAHSRWRALNWALLDSSDLDANDTSAGDPALPTGTITVSPANVPQIAVDTATATASTQPLKQCSRCSADFNITRARHTCSRCSQTVCKSCVSGLSGDAGAAVCRTCSDALAGCVDGPVQKWQRDEDAADCMVCLRAFGFTRLRHHCRRCGNVVCAACSAARRVVQGYGTAAQRVCSVCVMKLDDAGSDASSPPAGSNPSAVHVASLTSASDRGSSLAPPEAGGDDPLAIIAPWLAVSEPLAIPFDWRDTWCPQDDVDLVEDALQNGKLPAWEEAREARIEYAVLQPGRLDADAVCEDDVDDGDPLLWPAPVQRLPASASVPPC